MRRLAALACCAVVLVASTMPEARTSRLDDTAVEVGPGITPPQLESSHSTKYPRGARSAKGSVVLHALIDSKGRVSRTEVVSSPDKRLSDAAVAAMKKRRYTPATRGGEPIDVWWTETFQFIPPDEEIAAILACDPTNVDAGTATDPRDVVLPTIVRIAPPVWSDAMRAQGRPGHVNLQCMIDVCGRVGECKALETSGPDYTAAAIAAVQKRLYRPATAAGRPVAIYFTIVVDFRM